MFFTGTFSQLGVLLFVGIMMVAFADEQRSAGKTPVKAEHQASIKRSGRSLWTLAALMGAIPIAIGFGADGSLN